VDLAWPLTPPAWRALDVLVPVPLHRTRHRERGYNQARLLAAVLSERTGVRVAPHALVRVKATAAVAGLPLDQRAAMVEDAFVKGEEPAVRGKRVALVDDVVTTSATVRAACAVLREMGASAVEVICMARGGHGSES
jgi:ComF family protein